MAMRHAGPGSARPTRAVPALTGLLLVLAAAPARAVLDAAPSGPTGDDLVFTWDTGPDDLLRGASPDDLQPWLVAVTSPLVVGGENAVGAPDAYYALASGSNVAYRLGRTVEVPDPTTPTLVAVSLPERSDLLTSFDVLRAYPDVSEILWWDAVQDRWEGAGRVGAALLGDDEALPAHGGAWLSLTATATLRLVGSVEPAAVGWEVADLVGTPPDHPVALGLPPTARWLSGLELLCGERGVDWLDVDADGLPDECGTDGDGDGDFDTGLWSGPGGRLAVHRIELRTGGAGGAVAVAEGLPPSPHFVSGEDFAFVSGEAVLVLVADGTPVNAPFRPPTW